MPLNPKRVQKPEIKSNLKRGTSGSDFSGHGNSKFRKIGDIGLIVKGLSPLARKGIQIGWTHTKYSRHISRKRR
jgi:hypothetical protein